MTAARAGPAGRLKLYASMMRYGLSHNRDFARENWRFFGGMVEYLRGKGKDPRCLSVLDVGCGKTFWLTLLLSSYGARTVGFDTEPVTPRLTAGAVMDIIRTQGLERAARTVVWRGMFARGYYRELARAADFPLRFDGLDLRSLSVEDLPFDEGSFDLVVSHEVFEHLPDVPRALAALRRVMKPDGLTYIYVHNYTSLSGGHHIAWKYPDVEPSDTVPPWDHLRQNRFPDIPSWINRLRIGEYRRFFADAVDVLDWLPDGPEGEFLLTPEIEAELSEYTRDELLTKGFIVVARPR